MYRCGFRLPFALGLRPGTLKSLLVGSLLLLCSAAGLFPVATAAAECGGRLSEQRTARSTASCLACHDGSIGRDILAATPRRTSVLVDAAAPPPAFAAELAFFQPAPLERGPAWGNDHPIEIDYLEAYQRSPRSLEHPSQLDPRVRLEDGKVGCGSCHDLSSEQPARLVEPSSVTSLCRSCHLM